MKIGISTFGGDGGKSGISRYIVTLLSQFEEQLEEDQARVIVYTSERDIFIPKGARRLHALDFGDSLKPPVRNIFWHQASLPSVCRREKLNVMFLPAANRRLSLRLPCPMVGTVHDFSSIHVAAKYDPARMFYIRKVLPFMIRKLDHVLTVSESSRKDIIEYAGVPPERVTVTPLAADHSTYFPGDAEEARAYVAKQYGVDGPYILYTSRLEHPGKNHVRLIEAFGMLKARTKLPHRLVLPGSDWSGSEAVHEAAAKSAYAKDIHFPGFVPGADLPALYRGAEVFVFPSLFEGFGLPILEAMACGTPTTCSNVSSMPEVAGDAAPTFDPYSIEEIADAIERLLTDDSWRSECSRKCIARALQYNWKRTAETTLAVLRSFGS